MLLALMVWSGIAPADREYVRLSVDGYRKESPNKNCSLNVEVIEGLLSYEEK